MVLLQISKIFKNPSCHYHFRLHAHAEFWTFVFPSVHSIFSISCQKSLPFYTKDFHVLMILLAHLVILCLSNNLALNRGLFDKEHHQHLWPTPKSCVIREIDVLKDFFHLSIPMSCFSESAQSSLQIAETCLSISPPQCLREPHGRMSEPKDREVCYNREFLYS